MSGPGKPPEKAVWTEADFEAMGWHDNEVHGLAFEPESSYPGRLLLDVDYIVEWVVPRPPERYFRFWICPATLVFDHASDLVGEFDMTRFGFEPNILEIARHGPDEHGIFEWTIDGDLSTLRLKSRGFVQYLRCPPILNDRPRLSPTQRGGISFDERAYDS